MVNLPYIQKNRSNYSWSRICVNLWWKWWRAWNPNLEEILENIWAEFMKIVYIAFKRLDLTITKTQRCICQIDSKWLSCDLEWFQLSEYWKYKNRNSTVWLHICTFFTILFRAKSRTHEICTVFYFQITLWHLYVQCNPEYLAVLADTPLLWLFLP